MKLSDNRNYLWFVFILIISLTGNFIGSFVKSKNVFGSTILTFSILLIPFLIEFLRGKDPIGYYGLDFDSLKRINLKMVFFIALGMFVVISGVDFFYFNLWKIISNSKDLAVGQIAVILAKSNYFFLGAFVFFGGTLAEELWFRGVIQFKISNLKFLRKINPHFAIVLQSILFGLIHFIPIFYMTNFELSLKIWFFVYPFVVAMIIGYTNDKYRSLWPGWIIHFTNNLLSLFVFVILFRL